MRGGNKIKFRAGERPQPVNEAIGRPYSHPSPYGGWNALGNLSNMSPTEALQMDNFFPAVQDVVLRKGSITWVTGFASAVKKMLPYNGQAVSKMFASTNTGIFDVTASGTVGAAVDTCTNGQWSHVNFTTPGGSFLVLANGSDAVKNYDGAAWTNPAITGVTPSSLSYVTAHQNRLWFVQKNTMNLWYLGIQSIAGAATQFPVGSLFKRGGYVVAAGSWTIDNGAGLSDQFVIVTSEGEIAVYQGSDPATSATWALVGVYTVPLPLGNFPFMDFGGDLLYLSQNGLIPISQLTQSVVIQRSQQISFKIDGAFLDAAEDYKNNVGWEMVLHKSANFLLVNIPVSTDTVAVQFVMNTITRAWCRFTGWNASSWATLGSDLFYGGGGAVYKAWTGLSDSGMPIAAVVAQAYSPLGSRSQKNIALVRPNIGFSDAAQLSMSMDADFRAFAGVTSFAYASVSTGAIWDAGLWDSGLWESGEVTFLPTWNTIPCELGYLHSFRLQISSSQSTFAWTSTDFATRGAGIL